MGTRRLSSIVAVRSGHAGAQAGVPHCDHGVGVVVAANGRPPLGLALAKIKALDFAELRADPRLLLGVEPPVRLRSVLRQALEERRGR